MSEEQVAYICPMIFDGPKDRAERLIASRLTKMELGLLRQSAHITQKQMSDLSGLSTQCISDIESEKTGNPTYRSIEKYLDVLGYEICFRRKVI
mgnify:FL=1